MSHFVRFVSLLLLCVGTASAQERFGLDHIGEIVRLSDPQISPDGRSVAVIVSRADFEENRRDIELVLVDVATGAQSDDAEASPSPTGLPPAPAWRSFLRSRAVVSSSSFPSYAGRADGRQLLLVAPRRRRVRVSPDAERHNRSFEADVNYLLTEAPRPRHLWLVPAGGGEAERLTSGAGRKRAGRRPVNRAFMVSGRAGDPFAQQPEPGPRHISHPDSCFDASHPTAPRRGMG